MIYLLKKILTLINKKQRIRLIILQVLSLISGLLETLGTISAAPLIAIVADTSLITNNPYLYEIYNFFGSSSDSQFILQFSVSCMVLFTVGSLSSLFINYIKLRWATDLYLNITNNLFVYYIHLPWLYHSLTSSDELMSKLHTDTKRFQSTIILPFLEINSNLFILITIIISTFIVDYKIASIISLVFIINYFIIYILQKGILVRKGQELSKAYPSYFKSLIESFGGIRDVILKKKYFHFEERYIKFNKIVSNTELIINFLGRIPKTVIEIIAFIFFIFLYLFLIYYLEYSFAKSSSILAFYFLCASKLLPALQKIFLGYTSIKTHESALDNIELDLKNSLNKIVQKQHELRKDKINLFKSSKEIKLDNVSFNYKGRDKAGLSNLSLKIPLRKKIGIVGKTGSGKSTLVDIMMGLIPPDKGKVFIDQTELNEKNIQDWQSLLGYVPQNIFLTDDTIAKNIAFGVHHEDIDFKKINEVLELSNLKEFINNYDIRVGERGIRLSGGQKQRIAIARSLYNGSQVLFLDEATSSLDNKTERSIMESLKLLFDKKSIIIVAHKTETIKNCDLILLIEDGKIADIGSYKELDERTDYFKKS